VIYSKLLNLKQPKQKTKMRKGLNYYEKMDNNTREMALQFIMLYLFPIIIQF